MRRILSAGLILLATVACGEVTSTNLDDAATPEEESTPSSEDISDANNGGNDHFYWLWPVTRFARYSGTPVYDVSPVVEICHLDRQAMVCEAGEPILARFAMDGVPVFDRVFQARRGNFWVTWRRSVFSPEQDESYRVSVKVEDLELGFFDIEIRRGGRWWNLTRNDGFIEIADSGPFLFGFRIEEGALEQAFCDAAGQGLEDCDVEQVDDETGGTLELFENPGGTGEAPAAIIEIPANAATLDGEPISEYVVIGELEDDGVTQGGAVPQGAQIPFLVDFRTEPPGIEFDPNGEGVQITICQDLHHMGGIPEELHGFLRPFLVFEGGETLLPENFTLGAAECDDGGLASNDIGTEGRGIMGVVAAGVSKLSRFVLPEPLKARRLHGGLNTTVYNTRGREGNDTGEESDNAPPVGFVSNEFVVEVGALLDVDPSSSLAAVPNGEVDTTTEIVIHSLNGLDEVFPFGGADVEVTVAGANAGAAVTVVDNEDGTYTATYAPQEGGLDQIAITLNGAAISGSPYPSQVLGFTDLTANVVFNGEGSLGGVAVELYAGITMVGSVTTDNSGQAFFEAVPYGDYIIQAASGYDFDVRFDDHTQFVGLDEPEVVVDFFGWTQTLPAGAAVWRIADGGNGNAYEYVKVPGAWSTAESAAQGNEQLGVDGHLATLTSLGENTFANALKGQGDMRAWIGLTDAATEGTFAWVTGEPFSFANWGGGEPSDGGGSGEDYVEIFASAVWNDIAGLNNVNQGYLVEWEVSEAYPEPPLPGE